MVEMRKEPKVDMMEFKRKFLEENGIEEEDGKTISKLTVLIFEMGKDGRLESRMGSKRISLDWNSRETVEENELWICQVTMKTNFLGFADPVRRIETSEIIGMSDRMQAIADLVWAGNKEDVISYLGTRIDSRVESAVELRGSELESEYQSRISELETASSDREHSAEGLASEPEEKFNDLEDRLRKEYDKKGAELEEKLASVRAREEKLISEKSTIMSYYEFQNKALLKKIDALSEELRATRKKSSENDGNGHVRSMETSPPQVSGPVIRISVNEFKCPFVEDGRYSVTINAEMTKMRFAPDVNGRAICRNGIIAVPGLNMIGALGNRMGELEWTMSDRETLEIGI